MEEIRRALWPHEQIFHGYGEAVSWLDYGSLIRRAMQCPTEMRECHTWASSLLTGPRKKSHRDPAQTYNESLVFFVDGSILDAPHIRMVNPHLGLR